MPHIETNNFKTIKFDSYYEFRTPNNNVLIIENNKSIKYFHWALSNGIGKYSWKPTESDQIQAYIRLGYYLKCDL